MNREKITTEDDEFVTKGFLRQQLEKLADLIVKESVATREENREFRQMREQLYSNDVIQERKIDDLDGRILRLETVK
jgi:hypothetical protein